MGSAGGLPTELTLDAAGDSSAVFVFKVGGAFVVGAASTVTLINGAQSENVYWITGGATSIGISAVFTGTIIGTGAIVVGGSATILGGRVLSVVGAISMS